MNELRPKRFVFKSSLLSRKMERMLKKAGVSTPDRIENRVPSPKVVTIKAPTIEKDEGSSLVRKKDLTTK